MLQLFNFADVYASASMDRIALLEHGVGAKAVVELADRMHSAQDRIIDLLGLKRTTVLRKIGKQEDLDTDQAERLIGLSKLIGQVETLVKTSGEPKGFDAARWVNDWLQRPNPALGGKLPAMFMGTATGQEIVTQLVAQMASGTYA